MASVNKEFDSINSWKLFGAKVTEYHMQKRQKSVGSAIYRRGMLPASNWKKHKSKSFECDSVQDLKAKLEAEFKLGGDNFELSCKKSEDVTFFRKRPRVKINFQFDERDDLKVLIVMSLIKYQ